LGVSFRGVMPDFTGNITDEIPKGVELQRVYRLTNKTIFMPTTLALLRKY
jgi:hypothetical protein